MKVVIISHIPSDNFKKLDQPCWSVIQGNQGLIGWFQLVSAVLHCATNWVV